MPNHRGEDAPQRLDLDGIAHCDHHPVRKPDLDRTLVSARRRARDGPGTGTGSVAIVTGTNPSVATPFAIASPSNWRRHVNSWPSAMP
jgi:hypothetical protein